MDTEDNDMGFQHTGGVNILNCPSSGMNTNPMSNKVAEMAMSSGCMFKSSNGADPFLGSGWDPLVSLSQSENFGGSSMVPHSEFANNPPYPVGGSSMVHYPSDSGLVELVPKLPCFGSGSFSELVGSLGLPECPPNYSPNKEGGIEKTSRDGAHSQEDYQIPDEGASPNGKRKKTALESQSPFNPNKNFEGEQPKDLSGDSAEFPEEHDEKKQKIEQNLSANLGVKQKSKLGKDNSNNGENYIHVRARRGQATNSHSLAERVRRERISERMRLLQELVPGCNKITGKAVMLDEIINYVQSLQQQVEFLSMKLATVNPELNVDIEQILSKDILHSRSGSAPILGYGSGMSSSHPYPQGIYPGITSTNPPFHPMPQNVWENELQSLLQMGFDSNLAINNLGPNGRSK